MQKQAITQTNILESLKNGFKNIIDETKRKSSFSKLIICIFLLIPAQTLSECIKEFLDKKKGVEISKHNSKGFKKPESSDLTKKTLTFFNDSENGK